ncbi:MAG: protein translocase subunit SecD [Chloroflexi bacterium]|jgi:protein-export membrane protein SecD|uniref:Protein translocase subunit SecD n=1 Tax=Candidatus Thermofonsia Clade 3 bacterium TaxID=2364212 RepID=A0A2M8QGV6_9CHLR|nr:protein translocase subunit SecD [Candidatus Roseilinea sp. NK_OTU-006]PJF49051.1 MAG: protein translocase subunit SecD [Candidatus Thermofonsia Clade 3 bacterium]RMG62702.1 MAG: protein translocase subunit SecD [Chloroflexota bacterium]
MRQNTFTRLLIILALLAISAYIVLPTPKPDFVKNLVFWQEPRGRDLQIKQGLDLKGGLQVLLASDLPGGVQPTPEQMESARRIIEDRVNGLGVAEPIIQQQGDDRILVELPGVTDRNLAIDLIKQTGQLEFVDAGFTPLLDGTPISTTYSLYGGLLFPETLPTGKPISETLNAQAATRVYNTAFTGEILQSATPGLDNLGRNVVNFTIKPQFQEAFRRYTSEKLNQAMCIVLDQRVISCPTIRAVLSADGSISGNFTREGANNLALVLSYGSLPVPLTIETTRDVGATLGADSIRRSLVAGAIALIAMIAFMVARYRLPGLLSAVTLVFFMLTSLALFVLVPVTLTLPGIAGFLLSVAAAVDANVLIFERFREELRGGRTMRAAVEAAFQRAWPSIRDSNISTLITCAILFVFGNTFGASAVRGFAITLSLGIFVSLFSAMFVTRTLMRITFSEQAETIEARRAALLGV